MNQGNNYSAAVKTVGFAVLILLALSLLSGGRMGYGYNMYYGGGAGAGFGFGGVLASVLVLLTKVLWFVLIVSLVIGLFVALKNYRFDFNKIYDFSKANVAEGFFGKSLTCPGCGTSVAEDYKFCPKCKISLKEVCSQCGREIQAGWQCCPSCGSENKAAG